MSSRTDLEASLQEQIGFLITSCQLFDAGQESEAKRLAVTARLLVHDTDRSASLLKQLNMKGISFYSTGPKWDSKNLISHQGLLAMRLKAGANSYFAPLDSRPTFHLRWVPFDEWWREWVFDDRHGSKLKRRDIVLGLANKEGGAHIDLKLSAAYETIAGGNTLWVVKTAEGSKPLAGQIVLLSMRQIAHELLTTLKKAIV